MKNLFRAYCDVDNFKQHLHSLSQFHPSQINEMRQETYTAWGNFIRLKWNANIIEPNELICLFQVNQADSELSATISNELMQIILSLEKILEPNDT